MAEIRMWSGSLSSSKFKQHVLNKFSVAANGSEGWKNNRIYHYKLNENYNSSSVSSSNQTTLTIVDSSPKCNLTTNYDFTISVTFKLRFSGFSTYTNRTAYMHLNTT